MLSSIEDYVTLKVKPAAWEDVKWLVPIIFIWRP